VNALESFELAIKDEMWYYGIMVYGYGQSKPMSENGIQDEGG
jgi:hypothetical protein